MLFEVVPGAFGGVLMTFEAREKSFKSAYTVLLGDWNDHVEKANHSIANPIHLAVAISLQRPKTEYLAAFHLHDNRKGLHVFSVTQDTPHGIKREARMTRATSSSSSLAVNCRIRSTTLFSLAQLNVRLFVANSVDCSLQKHPSPASPGEPSSLPL